MRPQPFAARQKLLSHTDYLRLWRKFVAPMAKRWLPR